MKNKKGIRIALKVFLLIVLFAVFIAVYILDSVFLAGNAIKYGKFGSCASIITSVMLAAAFALSGIAMFSPKKRLLSGACAFLIVIGIVPTLMITNTVVAIKEYQNFDSAKWKDYINYVNCRQYMIDDLESRYKLVGMKIYDARELLGEGSVEDPEQDFHKAIYDIGADGLWHNIYVLEYDENGIITKTYTEVR